MKRKNPKHSINKSLIADLVLAKYRVDPAMFRQILPDLVQVLDKAYPTRQNLHPSSPFGLTERERAHRLAALDSIIEKIKGSQVSYQEAIRALEHCAVLTEDDSLPYTVDRRSIMRLLRIILGKPLTDVTSETTIEIPQDVPSTIVNRISLVRGAVLNLSQDMHLISLSVIPQKVKDWPRAMRLTSIIKQTQQSLTDKTVCQEDKHATS